MSTKLQDELGFALKHDGKEWLVIEEGTDDRCATITEQVLWKALIEALATPVAPAEPTEGWVLVPKRMTQEMRDVTDSEGWTWEDLLAEAGSISQEEYAAIAAAPVAPTEWTDAKLRGIASDYFPDRAHWPAAMLCLRHLLMEQSKFGATVAPVDHDEFSLFRNDLCDFLRHVIDMGKGDHYWDVVRGNAGALLRRVARIAPAVAPVAPAGDKPATSEPVAWQWRRKGEPWSREQTWTHEVFATTDDSEVRALYTAPPDVQRDADQFTQAIQRLNSIPYALTKDECIQAIRELRDSAKAPT